VPDLMLPVFGALSVALGLAGYVPYIRDTLAGRTKPHLFSWLIWAVLTAVGFAGQLRAGAGPGAWAAGVTVAGCCTVVVLAARGGLGYVTRLDWWCLAGAGCALALWPLAGPLAAVALAEVVSGAGFVPTVVKSLKGPGDETLSVYSLAAVKSGLAAVAVGRWSLLGLLSPVAGGLMEVVMVVVLVSRRRVLVGVLV